MPSSRLPFTEIAAACLARAHELLAEWLPEGRLEGHEYKALNPTRADGKIGSFSINTATGAWADFATSDAGNDLVSLYAYLFHSGEQGPAARELADRFGIALPNTRRETTPGGRKQGGKATEAAAVAEPNPPAATQDKEPRTWWKPIWPTPPDAGDIPVAHPNRGSPARVFEYRDSAGHLIGRVCRFITSDGGKDDIPCVFAQHEKSGKREWRWMAFAQEDRPLYGLDRAAMKPEASLLFVEGEKCADAGNEALPELATLAWPGGCNGVGKVNFASLADRQIKKAILWPDCDAKREKLTKEEMAAGIDQESKPLLPEKKQPGTKAMERVAEQLHALGYKVWRIEIPKPGEKPDGWDIADAIADGWTRATLENFIRTNAIPLPEPHAAQESISTPSEAAAGQEGKRPFIPGLVFGREGLKACMANVYQILAHSPEWAGVVGFDEFSLSVMKRKLPPFAEGSMGEWTSTDDSRTAIWLARHWDFTPSSDLVAEAVETLARDYPFHPVREYFDSLVWDERNRLAAVPEDFLGLPATEYTRRAVMWWMMGIAKRIYHPGAKFDHCLVLMGMQGKKKSTFFAVLAGEWFGDTDLDLSHKDSMSALRGKMIYEIPELGAFARSDSLRQKSFLSRRSDEYRPVYGRREIKAPRQCGFGGSTNEDEWNKDLTGGRRFMPLACQVDEIDEKALQAVRDQLWAEAVARVRRGERYWPTQAEQRDWFDPEQMRIQQQDSILDAIHDWVYGRVSAFSIFDVLSDCLKLDASKQSRDMQTRVGMALKKFGCRRVEKRNGTIRYWYEPPEERAACSTAGAPAQYDQEGDDAVGF